MYHDVHPAKRGKGRPDINSSLFLSALARFAAKHATVLRTLVDLQGVACEANDDPQWLLNIANAIFMSLDSHHLDLRRNAHKRDLWLLMSWCVMYCAEAQRHVVPGGWTARACGEARKTLRRSLTRAERLWAARERMRCVLQQVGVGVPTTDMSLLPRLAVHRLGIHQELCVAHVGVRGASSWKWEGLRSIQARMGSTKRHFDAALYGETDVAKSQEDHLVHLVWNFMAIFHTCLRFPHKNDHLGWLPTPGGSTPAAGCPCATGAQLLHAALES